MKFVLEQMYFNLDNQNINLVNCCFLEKFALIQYNCSCGLKTQF